jgi:hypothetical protein
MREEDRQGGSDKISAEGRGKLTWSEREALRVQHRNRDISVGSPAEVERRQGCRAVDMGMKAPRFIR